MSFQLELILQGQEGSAEDARDINPENLVFYSSIFSLILTVVFPIQSAARERVKSGECRRVAHNQYSNL